MSVCALVTPLFASGKKTRKRIFDAGDDDTYWIRCSIVDKIFSVLLTNSLMLSLFSASWSLFQMATWTASKRATRTQQSKPATCKNVSSNVVDDRMRRYRLAAVGKDWHDEECNMCTQINMQVKKSTALRSMLETGGVLADLIGDGSTT